MNSLIPVNGIERVSSVNSLSSETSVSSVNSEKRLSRESLALDSLDELEDILFEQHLATSSSTPSLYTAEKSKMIKQSEYYFDFLNQKRPPLIITLNPDIQQVEEKLDLCLKEKIQASVEARASKIFKKALPPVEQFKAKITGNPEGEEIEKEEIDQFILDLQKFQSDYQEFEEAQKKDVEISEEELWAKLVPDDITGDKRKKLETLFEEKLITSPLSFPKALQSVQNTLFDDNFSFLHGEASSDSKKNSVLNAMKEIRNHFGKYAPSLLKKAKHEKLTELYEELKGKHPANKKILEQNQEMEIEMAANLLKELASEHQVHTFNRFTKLFSCHANFVNSMIYLLKKMELKSIQPTIIQNIVVDMLSHAHLEENESACTGDHEFYRKMQGKGEGGKLLTAKNAIFNEKMKYIFRKATRQQFISRQDAHTIPFPGVFSWDVKKLKEKLEAQSISVSENAPDRYITSGTFKALNIEKNRMKLVQEAIDQLETEIPTNEGEFIHAALLIIMKLTLVQASETEAMPEFINQQLDQLSEVKLHSLNRVSTGQGKRSSSSVVVERDYKKLLGKNLANLVRNNKEVDFAEVFKENHNYIEQTLICLNARIAELTKHPIQKTSLTNLYELRLICDIWAAIENAEAEAKHPISPSITPKWHHLTQWIAA
ncbi:hypothetical protein [Candidatus Protochlamydia phocaeensis]|uniref:hypothetical protein n=1 Tax=Candidatus Protochlamydia phocaeensis TaxID=1414722 RepID=UPI0008383064|nr:hypothetical protein [Candidatus Protochlamydia phocaeensis]